MNFTIVSLFPEFFDSPLSCGLLARGGEAGLVSFDMVNPRDFTEDRHRSVDDRPYGGGPGMVMLCGPMDKALSSIKKPGRMLYMSPKGRPLTQELARELAAESDLTLVCGRYEGLDERIMDLHPLEAVSVGDFVLNGGESAALAVIESVSRLLPDFMGHEDSADEESFSASLLEYPHYTRPESYKGLEVPGVLSSGDHAKIAAWRREKSLEATLAERPDLLERAGLEPEDQKHLRRVKRARPGRNLHLALLHHPVLNKKNEIAAVSLTNLDVHDIARVSRTYGLGGYWIATPLEDQRKLLEKLVNHWKEGPGSQAIPDRSEALGRVRAARDLDEIIQAVTRETGREPYLAATSARQGRGTVDTLRRVLAERTVLLIMGTASGLAPEVLERADCLLRPVRYMSGYNHLSVRSATAITVDRILGDAY